MKPIKQTAVSGIKWSGVSQVGRQATQLLTTVILARLLLPSDFGLLGMSMVVIGFINIFKDLGTTAAIIQRRELSTTMISSIFWVNVCFGLAATVLLFLLAPLGGVLYQEPRVVIVLQVLSLSFFISGLGILHQALLERTLAFDSLAKLEVASVLVGAIIGIVSAILKAGVWSLVFQSLSTTFLTTVFLWLSSPWRPQRIFNWAEVKSVGRFSLNLTGFSILNYFARTADYILIGRYLGAQELGYYTLAYRILLFPIQNISAVIGRVLYPVLSTFQEDNERFASAYLRVVANIAFIAFPLMAGVFALAGPLIITFFGSTWRPVISLIAILAPVGLVQSIGTTVGTIYQAKGRTDWMFRWGIGAGIFVMIAFVFGLRWGVTGVAVAYAAATFLLFYPGFAIPFRLINLGFIRMFKTLLPSFLNSGLMLITLIVLRLILPASLSDVIILAVSTIIGAVVYIFASYLTNRDQLKELWDLSGLGRRKIHEPG